MNKTCVIYQPRGLGDILFLQKFASIQKSKGYKIYWPVTKEFSWLNDYISGVDFIPFPNEVDFYLKNKMDFKNLNIITDDYIFFDGFSPIPGNLSNRVMAYKYESMGLDYKDWASYLLFNRNKEKENYLFYDVLKLEDNKPYIFVNKNYQMRPEPICYNKMTIPSHLPVVNLDIINGISLFDWGKVIEDAVEIHMIETSLNYMMESPMIKPNLKANKLVLYSRHNNFSMVDYLFNIKWEYMICG